MKRIYVLIAILFFVFSFEEEKVPSIAIIPLENKGESKDDFYSYGISADLISDVSRAGDIRVASLKDIEKFVSQCYNHEDFFPCQIQDYIDVEYERNNVDVKLNFAIDLKKKNGNGGWKVETKDYMIGRMKTKSATVTGFGSGGGSRLEIEITRPRGGARYGSMGTNIQEVVIEKTETSGIRQLDKIRHNFPELYRRFGWGGQKGWHGRKAYEKALKEDPDGFVDIIAGEDNRWGNDRVVFNNGDGTFNFRKADDILVK